jgi:tagatose-1,6-bisphosphate aldolase
MPGYIKIGKTNDITRRIQDLDWTNMPLPFQCFYAARVEDVDFVERTIHSIFADNRVRSNREFFKVNPERVIAAIKLREIENVTPKQNLEDSPEVKEELEKIYTKRFNFSAVQIPIGSELTFTRDKNIKAKVVSDGNIQINGKIKSLSRAAQDLLKVDYPVQGPIFWIYDDETLDERRKRIENEE